MALGLSLCVSLIGFLLFDGSAGFPAKRGYMNGFLHETESRSLTQERSSYNYPSVAEQPELAPAQQTPPYSPTSEVESPVNGQLMAWAPEHFNKPLLFTLRLLYQLRDPAMPQPGSPHPQSLHAVYSNSMSRTMSSDDTAYASATAYYEPASVFISEPVRGYGVADRASKMGLGAHGSDRNNRHLVFEEIFHFPAEHTESFPLNDAADSNAAGDHASKDSSIGHASINAEPTFPRYAVDSEFETVYAPEIQSSFPFLFTGKDFNFGPTSYHSQNRRVFPQKPGIAPQAEVSEAEEGQSYLTKPRDGYE